MGKHLDRRVFLWAAAGAMVRPAWSFRQADAQRTLVLVQLSGGNDGLSMIVPWSDDAYRKVRPTTGIPERDVLRIDERIGMTRELGRLRELFGDGRLALFEGVGHPWPNRSHFRSLDTWYTARPRMNADESGWIGRCIERLEDPSPYAAVHLGHRPFFALASPSRPAVAVTSALLLAGNPERSATLQAARELERASPGENHALATVRAKWQHAHGALSDVHGALTAHRPAVRYPDSDFAQDMRKASALIHSELGVRVVSLELPGFDTHRDQRVRHQRLMAELDGGLRAFADDLAQSESGREALVLVYSEFGRRIAENGSRGHDHGKAGPVLALGTRVRGGLYGRPPSLTELDEGDLAHTTDFRSLYATCVRHIFGLSAHEILGEDCPEIAFV